MREDSPLESIAGFKRVVEMEVEKGEWGFKAIKQIIKLLFKLKKFEEVFMFH